MKYDLNLLKSRLPDYLRAIGCDLKFKNDDSFTTACPIHGGEKQNFHGDRKADGVWLWHCFSGCGGTGGTVIDLHARLNGIDAKTSDCIKGAAEIAGISPAEEAMPEPIARRIEPKAKAGISWPSELLTGSEQTWKAFAQKRKLSFSAVHAAVHAGILRFLKTRGLQCFAITDESERAGEVRRIDGKEFKCGKVYSLLGVDKSWMIGASFLRKTKMETPVLICEGSTDFLAAFDAYARYRKGGGKRSWLPLALLGASSKKLHPDLHQQFKGRMVRIAPDGDEAGEKMGDHWGEMLSSMGCAVEVLEMPKGQDLRDMLESGEIKPEELYS
ncbi:toprim domain-containing protein [Akkermansiaceae bacterium]|nr:toprim domain-containing protein [Akkermansiaceae bacterium]MDB4465132.1 toprim domain-containing protein [Akkermansiaceae bacterium]MDB4488914.1 toprim domain-containing protein [Akkermansiaceae bacterium]